MFRNLKNKSAQMSIFNKKPQSIKDIDNCLDADCSQCYTKNSAAFTFLTEDIDMFSRVDMNGKNILAVAAGSGDAMLAMLARGAASVDLFDMSLFPKYTTEFKQAALNALGRQKFRTTFNISPDNRSCNGVNFKYYQKIKSALSDECRYLFDRLKANDRLIPKVFAKEAKTRLHQIPYLNDNDAYAQFQKAAAYRPDFQWTSLNDLAENITRQYDIIYLSCIHDYLSEDAQTKEDLGNLGRALVPGGIIMANYGYDYYDDNMYRSKRIRFYSSLGRFKLTEEKLRTINDDQDSDDIDLDFAGFINKFFITVDDETERFDSLFMLTKTAKGRRPIFPWMRAR